MSTKSAATATHPKEWNEATQSWTTALCSLVRDEARKAAEAVCKEIEARAPAAPTAAAGPTAPAAGGSFDSKKIVEQVMNSNQLKERINQSLEQGLRGVLPQILQRLKAEIEERVKGIVASGGGGGGESKLGVTSVVNSAEMKEMLEERFRMMLLYITQEVIPKELQRHGVRA